MKRTCLRNETPTAFYLLCCVLGGKSRGASKCRNRIHGTIRRHSASRTSTWLPSFSQHLSADPLVKEASVCSAAQMQNTPQTRCTPPSLPRPNPIPNMGADLDFCCIQMKQECGPHSGPSQATRLSSDWLVLGNKWVIGQFKDGVAKTWEPGARTGGFPQLHGYHQG